MHSVGEVMALRAAGRGQQISEGGGGMWLFVRKKEVSNEIIIYKTHTLGLFRVTHQEVFNFLKQTPVK